MKQPPKQIPKWLFWVILVGCSIITFVLVTMLVTTRSHHDTRLTRLAN